MLRIMNCQFSWDQSRQWERTLKVSHVNKTSAIEHCWWHLCWSLCQPTICNVDHNGRGTQISDGKAPEPEISWRCWKTWFLLNPPIFVAPLRVAHMNFTKIFRISKLESPGYFAVCEVGQPLNLAVSDPCETLSCFSISPSLFCASTLFLFTDLSVLMTYHSICH